jgi:hypothetical protein
MSKTSNNAKFAALIPWLEELKKHKPKRNLNNVDLSTEIKTISVRDVTMRHRNRK